MTKQKMIEELEASKSEYVTYGEADLGVAVRREDAIADISGMDDDQIGNGTWYECDQGGKITE